MHKPTTENIISCLKQFDIQLPESIKLTGLTSDIHNDSRLVKAGDIFCAIIGHEQDGRQYIETAIAQGAKLVLAECESADLNGEVELVATNSDEANIADDVAVIVKFYQLNQNLFTLTKDYYRSPQDEMTLVGITGTNGKTTTSQLLAQMLNTYHKPCAVIGTNGAGALDNLQPIENTTPGACELHQLFNRFHQENFKYLAMEVSSHALSQKRVQADLFDIAVFTNLSRDHLDYHGSMASYGEAKKQVFTGKANQVAIVNFDDEQGKAWLDHWPKEQVLWLYGREEAINNTQHFVTAKQIERHSQGVSFVLASHLGCVNISSPLLGDFNIDNLLAAISVLLVQGIAINDIPALVAKVHATAGRMEANNATDLATAVVDYAHTPDALAKALQACRQHCQGALYVVFGCGGDRDKGKRPLMAKVAEAYADYLVITNDNPRRESPQLIANDIIAGLANPKAERLTITLDREQAVLNTIKKAKAGDIILLAGKGHEDYVVVGKYDENGDIIGTEKIAYNERLLVRELYQQHGKLSQKNSTSSTVKSEANL